MRQLDWEDDGFTAEDIPRLDKIHEDIGILEQWMRSARRADILSRQPKVEEPIKPNDDLQTLIQEIWAKLGRKPTSDEVYRFIYGTDEDRTSILKPQRARRVVQPRYHHVPEE